VKNIVNKLVSMKVSMDDELQAMLLLCFLPDSWKCLCYHWVIQCLTEKSLWVRWLEVFSLRRLVADRGIGYWKSGKIEEQGKDQRHKYRSQPRSRKDECFNFEKKWR